MTCNYDPHKALCNPARGQHATSRSTPSLDRCQSACPNISRTDTHIARIQAEIVRIDEEIDVQLAPQPLQQRLRQRQAALQAAVHRHEATRVTAAQHAPEDRP